MSILKAMNNGVAGLMANGGAMAIIGDNIANVNTIGFKSARANFANVLANTTLGIGDGVTMSSQRMHGQGSLQTTGNALDMAISGDGLFQISGSDGGKSGIFYTRAGNFIIDGDGFVTTPNGLRLQGYTADSTGNIGGQLGDLEIGNVNSPPNPSTEIDVLINLDSNAEIQTWDPNDPGGSSSYSNSVTLYDSLGNAIPADIYYTKTADNQWEYHVMVDGENLDGGLADVAEEVGDGFLDFDTDGNLVNHTPNGISFLPVGATGPQDIDIDFGETTQFSGDSTLRIMSQDGFAAGDLRGISIGQDGTILGVFSNGEEIELGQVAIAKFASLDGLRNIGGNMWEATQASGQALMGVAGTGGRGGVISGALEGSNVDLSHEFVKMIAVQRGFQANSKTITTGDQMLAEVINLKR